MTIGDCIVEVKNVSVSNGVSLVLNATYSTTIEGDFEVPLGCSLTVQ